MLDALKSLPEAASYPRFDAWLAALRSADEPAMRDLLRESPQEDRRRIRALLLAMVDLDRKEGIWKGGHERYTRLSSAQDDVVELCRFVCSTAADIKKIRAHLLWRLPMGEKALAILPWYVPDWFADEYTRLMDKGPKEQMPFTYEEGIACERMGALTLSPAFAAPALHSLLVTHAHRHTDSSAIVRDYPEILARDIWTLFAADIAYAYYYAEPFFAFIIERTGTGELDRLRVLRECLTAVNRHLSREQTSIYLPLFEKLAPTTAELLDLRDDLLSVLGSPNAKPVAAALRYVKLIATEASFPHAAFTGYLPALLSSATKAVRTAALAVAETIAKKFPEHGPELALAMPSAFSGPDESVQTRAAKFILARGDTADPALRGTLEAMRPQLLAATRALLGNLLADAATTAAETEAPGAYPQPEPLSYLAEADRISLPATVDDLVFMLAEAFANPSEHHVSTIPDALFALRDQIDDEALVRLGPAIAAARKILGNFWLPSMQIRIPAFLFVRWCVSQLEASQGKAKGLAALRKKLPDFHKAVKDIHLAYEVDRYDKSERYHRITGFKEAFSSLWAVGEAAFARLENNGAPPMLSSVTHAPCRIDPLVLVERLRHWQEAGREPHPMDLQLALQRCAREREEAVRAALGALEGEYRALLEYFFSGALPASLDMVRHPAWWVTAALMGPNRAVPPELVREDFGFTGMPREYRTGRLSWEVLPLETNGKNTEKEFVSTDAQCLILKVQRPKLWPQFYSDKEEKKIAELMRRHMPPKTLEAALEEYRAHFPGMTFTDEEAARNIRQLFPGLLLADSDEQWDWAALFAGPMFAGETAQLAWQTLTLYPNNPEPAMLDILANYGREKQWLALAVFADLLKLRVPMGPASNLFLALGLLTSNKEVRLNAAAFWRAKVEEGNCDGADIGRLLGQLEAHDWVPTKRFTDQVEKDMLGISPEHSRQLGLMLGAFLLESGMAPKVNIKRILELYYELATGGSVRPDPELAPLLAAWKEEKAYAAAAKRILALAEPAPSGAP